MAPGHTHGLGEWCPDFRCAPDRLRAEADKARTSPHGKHPEISVMTHAAALRYAADLLDTQYIPKEEQ